MGALKYMQTTFQNILDDVNNLFKTHSTLWFRGHSSVKYKLNSGLYRINKDKKIVENIENDLYNTFVNLGDSYCNKFNKYYEWNILFMMQHYGLYTRLLDWTSSFVTALYFANYNRSPLEDADIWVIDPLKLNRNSHNLYEKEVDDAYDSIGVLTLETLPHRIKDYTNYFNTSLSVHSFALMPRRSNERLIFQNGYFTVQGNFNVPLDEEYKTYQDILYKIHLPSSTYEESVEFLKLNGLNYYSMFGGVDGLCNYIKNELYNIKLLNL
jgi:hypothetical protein